MSILRRVENEPIITDEVLGKWEYVQEFADNGMPTGFRGYLHMTCDAITNRDGFCIMCGSPSPSIWAERLAVA